ncbi:MAG: adenylate/guanylate cyclase domain-containing protein [Nevskia sp.]
MPAAPPESQNPSARGEALAELLAQCRLSLQSGNYLQAYDQASSGQARGLDGRSLDYLSLLALANAGSTELALKRFRQLGLTEQDVDEDWLALEGRLLKDLALTGGDDAPTLFLRSGEAYHAAFLRTGGYFTAINAATTLLLGGRSEQALLLAQDVLARVMKFQASNETDDYYLRVTEAEAALLLGDVRRCRNSLREADGLLRGNLNVRSRTATQLRLICRHFRIGEDLLNALTLAPVIYVQRPEQSGFDPGLTPELPATASFVFAGLTQPIELAVVEHFQARQARLHLVLPAQRVALLDHWHRHHGAGWAMRLSRCLDQADEISVAHGFLDDEDRWCSDYVSAMALGLSRLTAKRLGCQWQAVELAQAEGREFLRARLSGDVNGSRHLQAFPRTEAAAPAVAEGSEFGRRFIGTLFADFVGYSRLSDADMPLFQSLFLGSIAEMLRGWQDKILLQHTWGDAVHIVTVDAESAADIASDIHAIVDRVRPSLGGPLAHLELRLAAHYAPVFHGVDPVEGTPTFFGSQLSFTARIEPVTPPGMIFVTEAFAARLALEVPERFVVEYAGAIDLAKRFGKYRLFSLLRVPATAG